MDNILEIQSHKGVYSVTRTKSVFDDLASEDLTKAQFLIDKNISEIYSKEIKKHLDGANITLIEASEVEKNVERSTYYVESLVSNGIKKDHTLYAIGGGITQDITCFLASTLFRGMNWRFVPTTLLAQADSCIGSKSSINVGKFKNLMGTFLPPQKIWMDSNFLRTLEYKDICSGIGEILKVHMINSKEDFESALPEIEKMGKDFDLLESYIWNSLKFKKKLIEVDEFDRGVRNVMNYGHSFGHAIESATNFGIPHGVAVTIGMDMANYKSLKDEQISSEVFEKWHEALRENYKDYIGTNIPLDDFISAISKDKKNVGANLTLITYRKGNGIEKNQFANDEVFKELCKEFLVNYFI